MYYNLRTNTRGRQGRRSKANDIVASSDAKVEIMDGIVADTTLKAGKHEKVSLYRDPPPPSCN